MLKKKTFFIILFSMMVVLIFSGQGKNEKSVNAPINILSRSDAWSGMNRTSPIVIASDADWAAYSSGGDGSAGTPWILENYLIECNSTGNGIYVSDTTDHVIIRDSYINESGPTSGVDVSIYLLACINIDVINVTMEAWEFRPMIIGGCDEINIENCTFENSVGPAGVSGIYIDGSNNTIFNNCTFSHIDSAPSAHGISIYDSFVGDCAYIDIVNCTFNEIRGEPVVTLGGAYIGHDFTMSGCWFNGSTLDEVAFQRCDNVTISNNTFHNQNGFNLGVTEVNNVTITNNTFISTLAASQHVEIADVTNVTINNNIFYDNNSVGISFLGVVDVTVTNNDFNSSITFGAGIIYAINQNITISNNTFDSIRDAAACDISATHMTDVRVLNNSFIDSLQVIGSGLNCDNFNVSENAFYNTTAYATSTVITNIDWSGNHYWNYFDLFPYAVTENATTNILEFEYVVNATMNDTSPMYAAFMYPRADMIYLNFYSNVDGIGIPFANLRVLLNNVPLTVTYPVIPAVLYRITISDFRNRSLYDEMLNLNDTGIYVNIGLDVAVQVFFNFYSSIDFFGLDFSIVRLYVDGERVTRYDPIMDMEVINVTITDFANVTIYSAILNLSVTGTYLDIGLPIAPITVHNMHSEPVVFNITRNGVTTGLLVGAGMGVILRFSTGNYVYTVYDDLGHMYVSMNVTFTGMDIIELGPYAPLPPIGSINAFRILSDVELAAFPGIAGSGTVGDPYVIENYFIIANQTYTYSFCIDLQNISAYLIIRGMILQGARDIGAGSANIILINASNVVFSNCTSQDVGDLTNNVLIQNSENVTFTNCTLDGTDYSELLRMFDVYDTVNFMINSTVISNAFIGVEISNVTFGTFTYNTLVDVENGIVTQDTRLCHEWTVSNNTFEGATGIFAEAGIKVVNSENWTIIDNEIYDFVSYGIYAAAAHNSIILDNIIHDVAIGIQLHTNTLINVSFNNIYDCSIAGMTLYHFNNSVLYNEIENCGTGMIVSGLNFHVYTMYVMQSNTIHGCVIGMAISNSDDVVLSNMTVEDSSTYAIIIYIDALNFTCENSYFKDNAALLYNETSINVFEYNRYYEYFDVYATDVFLNMSTTELESDYAVATGVVDIHPMYHASWYESTRNFYIYFNSSIDGFGLPFDLVSTYIDGEQIGDNSIVFTKFIFRITVRAGFTGDILYDALYNYNTSAHKSIELAIAYIAITNKYDYSVIFTLTKSGHTISYILPGQTSIFLRLSTGTYGYTVKYLNGTMIIDDGSATFDILHEESFEISFGFTTVALPVIPSLGYTFLDTILSSIVFGVLVLVIVILYNSTYFKKLKTKLGGRSP